MGLQARGAGRPGFNIDEEKRKDPRELELKILKNRSAALGQPIPLRYYPASPVLKKDRAVSRETCPSNSRRFIFECKTPGRI